jgi:hypothetical protein
MTPYKREEQARDFMIRDDTGVDGPYRDGAAAATITIDAPRVGAVIIGW